MLTAVSVLLPPHRCRSTATPASCLCLACLKAVHRRCHKMPCINVVLQRCLALCHVVSIFMALALSWCAGATSKTGDCDCNPAAKPVFRS